MYGHAMKRIVDRLKTECSIPISNATAVDFFARDGGWQTVAFAAEVGSVCAWEIDPQYLPALEANLPKGSEITLGNSYEIALRPENKSRFDFIVIDNPQGIFGDAKCEHFEALPLVSHLAKQTAVLIFNVNIQPFNYDQHPAWAARRIEYYGRESAQLSMDFVLDFYRKKLNELGFSIQQLFAENRAPADYLYSISAVVENNIR